MAGIRVRTGLAALAAIGCCSLVAASVASAGQRPNVVVIVTDDQTLEQFRPDVMPATFKKLVPHAMTFRQAIVSTPQCCPSRAGYLSGRYAHNNGVVSNLPGYPSLKDKRAILPVWLQRAGYRTLHVGKYLNGYAERRGRKPAPGWDRWLSLVANDYLNPSYSIDGRFRRDGRYVTAVLNGLATRMIDRYAKKRRPFYLQIDQLAPHVGNGNEGGRCSDVPIPAPQDMGLFEDAQAPRSARFSEADVSDKPQFIQRLAPFSAPLADEIDRSYGCALAAMRSVDRGVDRVLGELRRSGELGKTMVAITSDNGYSYGSHRIPLTKGLAYQEHLRVPLVIRPPRNVRSPRRASRTRAPVSNIDLAPTILDLAGARPCTGQGCSRLDGRSLLPVLRGRRPGWERRRAIATSFAINKPTYGLSCTWEGLWQPDRSITHHTELPPAEGNKCQPADVFEFYDLDKDPLQLNASPAVPARLQQRVASLSRCSGIRGHDPKLKRKPFCE